MIREEGWYVTDGAGTPAATMRHWTPLGVSGYWSAPCYVDDPEAIRIKARSTYGETQNVQAGARVTFDSGYATVKDIWDGMAAAMADSAKVSAAINRHIESVHRAADRTADATFLRGLAATLSYNNANSEAGHKHRLHEIAMRVQSGYYDGPAMRERTPPAVSVIVVRPN